MFDEQVDVLSPSRNKRQTGRFIYFLKATTNYFRPVSITLSTISYSKDFFTPKYFPSTISVSGSFPRISRSTRKESKSLRLEIKVADFLRRDSLN